MSDGLLVAIAWIVALVVVTVAITALSRRVGWSAPIALVAIGAIASYVPAIPRVEVQPELVLYGLLPPLLFAAAIQTSFIDIRARRDPILLSSVGLVAFTVVVVGFTAWLIVPALTLAAAFAFGAVVAPTDAVAVTALTRKARLPRSLTTLLEGESLLNDATSLVALNAAIAAIITVLNPWTVVGDFAIEVVGGVAVGLGVGFVLAMIRKRLRAPVLDTSLSLVTPYIAFILATVIHGSGLLAVVIAGLFLGYRSPFIQSAEARIAERLNWRTIQFLLENAVFLFIGLSLSSIVDGALDSGLGVWQTIGISVIVLAVLAASRLLWGVVITAVFRYGPQSLRRQSWHWNQNLPFTLAGVRGVVTLAAVFLLPPETPNRELLQLLAFVVVVGTLLQGLALPFVIRHLTLTPPNLAQEKVEMQLLLAEAQTAGLERLHLEAPDEADERVMQRLRTNATFLTDALANPVDGDETLHVTYSRLRRITIGAERDAVLAARAEGRYQEPAIRSVLAVIDAEEIALKTGRGTEN
jgi:CPA1 family monovalent cation:H+ antiporter